MNLTLVKIDCGQLLRVRVAFEDRETDYIFDVRHDGVARCYLASDLVPDAPVQTPEPAAGGRGSESESQSAGAPSQRTRTRTSKDE